MFIKPHKKMIALGLIDHTSNYGGAFFLDYETTPVIVKLGVGGLWSLSYSIDDIKRMDSSIWNKALILAEKYLLLL